MAFIEAYRKRYNQEMDAPQRRSAPMTASICSSP